MDKLLEQEPTEKLPPVITLEWNSHIPYKKEREDSLLVDETNHVFVVADGVSRTKNEKDEYPYPSPARMASRVAADAMGQALADGKEMKQTFADGNAAVKKLNEKLGLWDNHDYWVNDFAGTVGAVVVERDGKTEYGYIGDCGVAHISATGELLWHSDDDVEAARVGFPKMEHRPAFAPSTQEVKDRFIKVRKDFRNNPKADYKTFGVLTGEDAALEYVKTGSLETKPGELVVVYSDGILPFILKDPVFRGLLLKGDQEEIRQYIDERSSQETHYDEKTVIILRK
jgi:hypothetical protein